MKKNGELILANYDAACAALDCNSEQLLEEGAWAIAGGVRPWPKELHYLFFDVA